MYIKLSLHSQNKKKKKKKKKKKSTEKKKKAKGQRYLADLRPEVCEVLCESGAEPRQRRVDLFGDESVAVRTFGPLARRVVPEQEEEEWTRQTAAGEGRWMEKTMIWSFVRDR